MYWIWLSLEIVAWSALGAAALLVVAHLDLKRRYLSVVVRIFEERPLFVIPRGQPVADAEEVRFPTADGLMLTGCYFATTASQRRGVILFGLEFGSNRWACLPYCDFLRDNGFDIFTFEFRSQGESDHQPGYEPLQWVTDFEVRDVEAALAYLKSRADVPPRGVGFFGISKGASAGLLAASLDPFVCCCVTDGVFATHTTMLPYMRKWVAIYSDRFCLQKILPTWYYSLFAKIALRRICRDRACRFPHLEHALGRLAPRPLLMIHGGGDTYIKPEMARALYERARTPKDFWLVDGAKHNQALQVAGDAYRLRVLEFFGKHLAGVEFVSAQPRPSAAYRSRAAAPPCNGTPYLASARQRLAEET